jgi:LysM repeat protein
MNKQKLLQLIWRFAIISVFLLNAAFFTTEDVAASGGSCKEYHTVQYGDTLYKIGVWYNAYWPDIANANGIGYPYTIYAGQKLCIPYGSSSGTAGTSVDSSSTGGVGLTVTSVKGNDFVTVVATNLPKKENFEMRIGKCNSSSSAFLENLKTGTDSGTFTRKYDIPSKYKDVKCLTVYMESIKSSKEAYVSFDNKTNYSVSPVPASAMYFQVIDVEKNSSVTIKIYNLIKGKKYKVFFGPQGSGAPAGYSIDSFIASSSSKPKVLTYSISKKYKDRTAFDIRVEGMTTPASMVLTIKNQNY